MRVAVLVPTGLLVVASTAFALQDRVLASEARAFAGSSGETAAAPRTARPVAPETAPWKRPDGPVRVALQAGHWKAAEAPDEQAGLRGNGTRGGGKAEWEVNLEIARRTAAILENSGYVVEILPTTIPPRYWADLFVSIHADGNPSPKVSGFRVAAPRRDQTGKAQEFADLLQRVYEEATGIPVYPTLTRRMRNYYAFNSRRYTHALHPMTVGVILETGFLTSPTDRRVIVGEQERVAQGIADAVILYLETSDLRPQVIAPSRNDPLARAPASAARPQIAREESGSLRAPSPSSDGGR